MNIMDRIRCFLSPRYALAKKREELVSLYKEMYELTVTECASCRVPHSCCSPEYCDMAADIAHEQWDVDLEPLRTGHPMLPFMGKSGCVVAPHLRPLCTLHTCDMNGLGYKRDNPEWTARYDALRNRIMVLEYEVFRL